MAAKAYSYVRFSSKPQERGDSVRRQTELATQYAARHGLDLDTELTFADLGKSAYRGRNIEAGRLGEFLEAVRAGIVPEGSYLLVETLDRITRADILKAQTLFLNILALGVKIVSLREEIVYSEDTVLDKPHLLYASLGALILAHDESKKKGGRVAAAWSNKRKNAHTTPLTSTTVAWCKLHDDGGDGGKRIVTIPERVKIVRRMFRMTLDGKGKEVIARTLNHEGIEPWGKGRRKATQWHRSYIAKILSNPAVYGVLEPLRDSKARIRGHASAAEPVTDYYPAIIDRETFDRVQLMKQAQHRAPRTTGGELRNLFAGLLRCPTCGGTMTTVNKGAGNGQRKVTCVAGKEGAGCVYKTVPYAPLEEAFMNRAEELLELLPTGNAGEDAEVELANLSGAVDAINDQRDNLLRSLQRSPESRALLTSLRAAERDLEQMRTEWQALADRIAAASGPMVALRMDNLAETLKGEPMDRHKVNAELRQVFAGITVDYESSELAFEWKQGGEARIHYASPFPEA